MIHAATSFHLADREKRPKVNHQCKGQYQDQVDKAGRHGLPGLISKTEKVSEDIKASE